MDLPTSVDTLQKLRIAYPDFGTGGKITIVDLVGHPLRHTR